MNGAQQPLPPGWEAKWDSGQNRYFFINHNTKTTTWVDPRQSQKPAQPVQSPYGQFAHYAAYGSGAGYSGWSPAMRMQEQSQTSYKCSKCSRSVKNGEKVCSGCKAEEIAETEFNEEELDLPHIETVDPDPVLAVQLSEEYPDAKDYHINSALIASDNELTEARHNLEKKGYKKIDPVEVKNQQLYEKLRPKYNGLSEDFLKTTIKMFEGDEASVLAKLKDMGYYTEEQKREIERKKQREAEELERKKAQVESKIREEFSSMGYFEVTSALKVSEYDEDTARALLHELQKEMNNERKENEVVEIRDERSRSTSLQPAKTSTHVTTSIHHPPPPANKPATSLAGEKINQGKLPMKKNKENITKGKNTSSAAKQKAQNPPIVVTERRADEVPTWTERRKVERQALRDDRTRVREWSQGESRAKGRDASLVKGPQSDILIKSYISIFGPDKGLVRGPQCRAAGSLGALGPDPTLVKGPMGVLTNSTYV